MLEDGLLREYLVIIPKKSKLKNLLFFRKLPVQKTGRTGPGYVPVSNSSSDIFQTSLFDKSEMSDHVYTQGVNRLTH